MSDSYLAQRLKDLTSAKRPVVLKDEIRMVDDNATSLEAVKTGLKIKGHLTDNSCGDVNISIGTSIQTKEDLERLAHIMERAQRFMISAGLIKDSSLELVTFGTPALENGK